MKVEKDWMQEWSYNYITKIASNSMVGVIKTLKRQHIDLMEQDANFTCGPASIQNLFRLLHREMPAEENLAHVLKCNPDTGTAPENIVWYLKRAKIPFVKYDPNRHNLDKILAANYAILVEYQDYQKGHSPEEVVKDEASHFAVLVGFDANSYYVIDPYFPKDTGHSSPLKRIPKQVFLKNWTARSFDGTHVMHNWGLIVRIPTL